MAHRIQRTIMDAQGQLKLLGLLQFQMIFK